MDESRDIRQQNHHEHHPSLSWSQVLAESRAFRDEQDGASCSMSSLFVDTFQPYFPLVEKQLISYLQRMERASTSKEDEEDKESVKHLILDTRNALRFGLSCFSLPDSDNDETKNHGSVNSENDNVRKTLQNQAINSRWHECLCRLLCCHHHPKIGDDVKCRLYAARLLCNIVTRCFTSASAVVSMLALSPTRESIRSRLQQETALLGPSSSNIGQDILSPTSILNDCASSSCNGDRSNWLDMILVAAKCQDRNVLAAVVAALHNCIASLSSSTNITASNDDGISSSNIRTHDIHPIEQGPSPPFHEQVASDKLIIASMLRQVISANKTIQNNIDTSTPVGRINTTLSDATLSRASLPVTSCADVATEWILMLLLQLFRLGLLPQLYAAAAGGATTDSHSLDIGDNVVPEQVVLLHCLIKGIEDESEKNTAGNGGGGDVDVCSILGDNPNHAVHSHLFLARLFVNVHRDLSTLSSAASKAGPWWVVEKSSNKNTNGHHDYALERSLLLIILDIMGETLGADTVYARRIRTEMTLPPVSKEGTAARKATSTSTLMETILMDLGQIVDMLLARNQATTTPSTSVRDFVMLESEQRLITILIRVVGNLCFQCRPHQDLLRTTLVACSTRKTDTTPPTSTPETTTMPRTGLHVLLSCTSFAHACFTLREWSIVAIRNALHENRGNQAVVADLEAQQPVQSATLDSMGIRLGLDSNTVSSTSY